MNLREVQARFVSALLVWFPFGFLLCSIPVGIFLHNQSEFQNNVHVLAPFAILASVIFFVLFLVGKRIPTRFAVAALFVGWFMLFSDVFAPLDWGIFDGENVLQEPLSSTLIELALAVALLTIFLLIPAKHVRLPGAAAILVLMISQGFQIFTNLEQDLARADIITKSAVQDSSAGTKSKPEGNVYQIVFDAYSGFVFRDALARTKLQDPFKGFTFFEKALSNYVVTDASAPSFLTGTFYQRGSYRQWQMRARNGGIRGRLHREGYKVSIYAHDRRDYWHFDDAHYVRTKREIAKQYVKRGDFWKLAQISLVRAAPNVLRHESYWLSKVGIKIASSLFNYNMNHETFRQYRHYKALSVPLFREFIRDESKRESHGHYVHLHVVLPHTPFKWNSNCEYALGKTSYEEQVDCSTKLMGEFINELKLLGRFENATIIFQSDHGYHRIAPEKTKNFRAPQSVLNKLEQGANYFSAQGVVQRFRVLLAIKPAFAVSRPLVVSQAPVQLVDLPATLYSLLDIRESPERGKSVFDVKSNDEREIQFFVGFYSRKSNRKTVILGKTLDHADIIHLSYQRKTGWKIREDIPAIK